MDDAMVGPVRGDYDNGGGRGVDSPNLRAREQDKFLPIAIISRIMKQAVPINGKIAKEAKDAMQECVSEFISFITSEASYKCQKEKRKTINGDDLLWAMSILGFEDYIEPLRRYLAKYREMECDSKGPAKCEGSFQKDGGGNRSDFKSQVTHQESFTEAMHYMNSQATTDQHPVAPIPDSEWNSG